MQLSEVFVDFNKLKNVFMCILSILIIITVLLYFFYFQLDLDSRALYIQVTMLSGLVCSVIVSLYAVLNLGSRSLEIKYYLSLVIAMSLWLTAESIWTYYQVILKIEMPYPSEADFFWLLGFVFFGYHYFSSLRFWKQARVLKLYSIVIAVALTSVLIGDFLYLSFSTGMDLESDTLTTIVNIMYILGNGSLLIPAIIVF